MALRRVRCPAKVSLVPHRPRLHSEADRGRLLAFRRALQERVACFGRSIGQPMKIEGQTFLDACNDIMLTPELEWTIVVEQPVEPPGERARRSRKDQNLMGPALRASATRPGLPWALIIMAGTRASGPERARRMVLTSAGPVRGCIMSAAMTRSGVVLASASMASPGFS
jgi:hypothetical protein